MNGERPKYQTWDGLEEEEFEDLRNCVRDLTNALNDKKAKETMKRASKAQDKTIDSETQKLVDLVRDWVSRPRPETAAFSPPSQQERTRLRKLHTHVRDGLRNPVKALDPDFLKRLRELVQGLRIGTTDLRAALPADDEPSIKEEDIDMDITAFENIMTDGDKIIEAAERIEFSPAPSFGEAADLDDESDQEDVIKDLELGKDIEQLFIGEQEDSDKWEHYAESKEAQQVNNTGEGAENDGESDEEESGEESDDETDRKDGDFEPDGSDDSENDGDSEYEDEDEDA